MREFKQVIGSDMIRHELGDDFDPWHCQEAIHSV